MTALPPPAVPPPTGSSLYGAVSAVWNNQYSRAAVLVGIGIGTGIFGTRGYQYWNEPSPRELRTGRVENNKPGYTVMDTQFGKVWLENGAEPLLERAVDLALYLNVGRYPADILVRADRDGDHLVTRKEMAQITYGLEDKARVEEGLPKGPAVLRASESFPLAPIATPTATPQP